MDDSASKEDEVKITNNILAEFSWLRYCRLKLFHWLRASKPPSTLLSTEVLVRSQVYGKLDLTFTVNDSTVPGMFSCC